MSTQTRPPDPPPDPLLHVVIRKGGFSPLAFVMFAPVLVGLLLALHRMLQ